MSSCPKHSGRFLRSCVILFEVQVKLPAHLCNLALIRKTVITIVADNDVLVNRKPHKSGVI